MTARQFFVSGVVGTALFLGVPNGSKSVDPPTLSIGIASAEQQSAPPQPQQPALSSCETGCLASHSTCVAGAKTERAVRECDDAALVCPSKCK